MDILPHLYIGKENNALNIKYVQLKKQTQTVSENNFDILFNSYYSISSIDQGQAHRYPGVHRPVRLP